ncbi:MAG: ion channel [Cyclobacteriaceae bacterium]
MPQLYLFLGISIFVLNLSDFLITVFSPKGAGFITEKINSFISKIFALMKGKAGRNKLYDYKVVFLILSIIVAWVVLSWLAFAFIYLSRTGSIINSATKINASTLDVFYFVGYTMSSLGPGEFEPSNQNWYLFTNFVSFFGFFIITICITYIVPLLNNIVEANALSLSITSLGETTKTLLTNSFNGEDFSELTQQFAALSMDIIKYSTRHMAYPVLHHVQNSNTEENIILKLVSLDETLNVLLFNVPKRYIKHPLGLKQVRRSINIYLDNLKNVKPALLAPPIPDFEELKNSIPIEFINTDPAQLKNIYDRLESRRKLHKANIENEGWKWSDLNTEKFKSIDE